MGVQLADIVSPMGISFEEMRGRWIAIDAMNSLYQFLSIIRQPTGEPLRDAQGRVTSHLSGIFYRNVNLIENGILPVYVFDGRPPRLKGGVVEARKEVREKAREKWKEALAGERYEEARTYAQQASRLTGEMIADSKALLGAMGIGYVEAPSEGEAQASYMAARGDAWAAGSQDYDSLLFGAPRLLRNLTVTGKRKMPRRSTYVEVKPEIFKLEDVLSNLDITREQLIDIAILVGTDYDPKGVEGIGPKKALKLVKEHGSADRALEEKGITPDFEIEEIRALFLEPEVADDYRIESKMPDREKALEFLCEQHSFSPERVQKALERLEKNVGAMKSQSSLDSWF